MPARAGKRDAKNRSAPTRRRLRRAAASASVWRPRPSRKKRRPWRRQPCAAGFAAAAFSAAGAASGGRFRLLLDGRVLQMRTWHRWRIVRPHRCRDTSEGPRRTADRTARPRGYSARHEILPFLDRARVCGSCRRSASSAGPGAHYALGRELEGQALEAVDRVHPTAGRRGPGQRRRSRPGGERARRPRRRPRAAAVRLERRGVGVSKCGDGSTTASSRFQGSGAGRTIARTTSQGARAKSYSSTQARPHESACIQTGNCECRLALVVCRLRMGDGITNVKMSVGCVCSDRSGAGALFCMAFDEHCSNVLLRALRVHPSTRTSWFNTRRLAISRAARRRRDGGHLRARCAASSMITVSPGRDARSPRTGTDATPRAHTPRLDQN